GLLPGETEIAFHRDHAQPNRLAAREVEIARIAVVPDLGQMFFGRLVCQVAGGDHMRDASSEKPAGTPALGQVNLEKPAVFSSEAAKRVKRFHNAGALGPATAGPAGKSHHGHRAASEGTFADGLQARVEAGTGVEHLIRTDVIDLSVDGEAVLRQADPPRAHLALHLLMLDAIEAIAFEQ